MLLDGHDLAALEPSWLRRHVALVNQEPCLFARSVAANIAYGLEGDERPDAAAITAAARRANAHEFIEGFEQGYDTAVGERGAALSGGQKQRIAVARAIIRQPRVPSDPF